MQEIVAELIRGLGHLILWLLTLGRYRSRSDALLLEGGIGLLMLVAIAYVAHAVLQ